MSELCIPEPKELGHKPDLCIPAPKTLGQKTIFWDEQKNDTPFKFIQTLTPIKTNRNRKQDPKLSTDEYLFRWYMLWSMLWPLRTQLHMMALNTCVRMGAHRTHWCAQQNKQKSNGLNVSQETHCPNPYWNPTRLRRQSIRSRLLRHEIGPFFETQTNAGNRIIDVTCTG